MRWFFCFVFILFKILISLNKKSFLILFSRFCFRMLLCFTASPCGSSCRLLAKNCPTPSINMMPPAESLLDSPKRSLLQEKVSGKQVFVSTTAGLHSSREVHQLSRICSILTWALYNIVRHVFLTIVFFSLHSSCHPQAPGWIGCPSGCPSLSASSSSEWLTDS